MLLRFSFNQKITLFTNAPSFCIEVGTHNFSLMNKNRSVECKYVFMGIILCLIKISNALGLITSKIIKRRLHKVILKYKLVYCLPHQLFLLSKLLKKNWVIVIDSHHECKIVRFPYKLLRANSLISCQNINTVTKPLLIRWHGWLSLKINYHEFYPVSLKTLNI